MSGTCLYIHCSQQKPCELDMKVARLSGTCALDLVVRESPKSDRNEITLFLPASMHERLVRAVAAFNAAMESDLQPISDDIERELVRAGLDMGRS